MKPKDLKAPFTWKERCVLLEDGVLFAPQLCDYSEYSFPTWKEIFGNNNPVSIEYCAGNGDWVAQRAQAQPGTNWVAVEKRFDRVRKIWSKRENFGLKNLLIVCAEAYTVTDNYFPDDSVAAAYINFPDPWPKKRHEKHRLIHEGFVGQIERMLLRAGTFSLATDHSEYAERFVELVLENRAFLRIEPESNYGSSWFERLWREKGRDIHYVRFSHLPS